LEIIINKLELKNWKDIGNQQLEMAIISWQNSKLHKNLFETLPKRNLFCTMKLFYAMPMLEKTKLFD
jgi:hypothetical protein